MSKYFPLYEEVVSHIWLCNCSLLNFHICEENFIVFFISTVSMQILWNYGLLQQFAYNVKIRPLAAEYKRPIDPLQLCYWPNKFNVSRHEPINGSDRIWVLPKESKEPSGPATYGLEGSQPYITFIMGLYLLYLCLYEYICISFLNRETRTCCFVYMNFYSQCQHFFDIILVNCTCACIFLIQVYLNIHDLPNILYFLFFIFIPCFRS